MQPAGTNADPLTRRKPNATAISYESPESSGDESYPSSETNDHPKISNLAVIKRRNSHPKRFKSKLRFFERLSNYKHTKLRNTARHCKTRKFSYPEIRNYPKKYETRNAKELRIHKKREKPLNVNIFHESQMIQVAQPVDIEIHRKAKPKGPRGNSSRPVEDLIKTSKNEDSSPLPYTENVSFNINHLMQHITMHHAKESSSDTPSFQDSDKRAFPFQPTPSGNLKIIPNQVVYESKKVSVLVADPKHAKVNVQAQLNHPNVDINPADYRTQIKQSHSDLPPGITPSSINHLQFRKKVSQVEGEYRPRTQPYVANNYSMQKDESSPTTSEPPQIDDVPLSSLGFTADQPIDWETVVLPEKTDLYQELARRITNYKNADCIVRIGNDEFHCHLLVLQSYSSFFDDKNIKQVDITGTNVTSNAFSIIYDWMISSTNESCRFLRRDNILEVFTAAQFLGIKELEEQCWAFIDNDELFSEDTAFLLYLEARKIGNTAVMELMVPRIMKFFLLLVGTTDFFDLSVEELCLLLKSNYICVNSEMEVLMSAVRWLMYNWEERKQYMIQVLKCVRFGLIAPWQLVDIKRNPENPEFIELMSYPEVQKMVDDGLGYVIIKYWYGTQTEDYHHWIELLGLTEPNNRHWAGEDKNYVTYREFLSYLEEYREITLAKLKERHSKSKADAPKDTPQTTSGKAPMNYPPNFTNPNSNSYEQGDMIANSCYESKTSSNGVLHQSFNPSSDMFSPEVLKQYLNNLDRNKGVNRGTGNAKRIGKSATFDNRLNDEGESSNKVRVANQAKKSLPKMGHRREHTEINDNVMQETGWGQQQQCDILPSMKKQQKMVMRKGQTEVNVDSAKSEDEAATFIQAFYRGYKARRKFYEIKRRTSEEKRSTKKVAELLAIPDTVNTDNDKKLKKMNDDIGDATHNLSINVNGIDSEKELRSISYNDMENTIEYIKYPAFDYNDESNVQSVSELSSITDEQSAQIGEKSIVELQTHEILYQNPMYKNSTNPIKCYQNSKKKNQKLAKTCYTNEQAYLSELSLYFSDKEAVLVFGGIDPYANYGSAGNTGKDIYRYIPANNTWEFAGEMPEPRYHHSVAFLKGRVYLVGGVDPRITDIQRKGNVVATVWSFDPATRNWYEEPKMCVPRRNFGLVASHGRLFAFGGQDKNGVILKTGETYDPSECAWKEIQPMNMPRMGHAVAKYGNLIWIAGGIKNFKKESLLKEVECYDPVRNTWTKTIPLTEARAHASMFVISNDLYIIGGAGKIQNETQSMSSIDIWDSNTRTWKYETEMSISRYGHSVGSIGDCILIIGGVTTSKMETLNIVECYSCERKKWLQNICPLPYSISSHSVASLPPLKLSKSS